MNQEEIRNKLHRLRYDGGWSLRGLAKQCGLATSTITAAMTAQVSGPVQARFSNVLKLIPRYPPAKIRKGKPGHFKRYLIRYYNLRAWLAEIEREPGITKHFRNPPQSRMSRDVAAYVCARYDYQMKRHLLDLFGEHLKRHKAVMCDAYPAEAWIERIHELLPGVRPMLFKKIMVRGK